MEKSLELAADAGTRTRSRHDLNVKFGTAGETRFEEIVGEDNAQIPCSKDRPGHDDRFRIRCDAQS